MTPVHDFEQSFAARAIKQGGLDPYPAGDALALIEAAKAHGAPVLGVETFLVAAGKTCPQMDHILDLSGADKQCDTWDEARRFISERSGRGFLFEVVL
jgi:hypothetical protein